MKANAGRIEKHIDDLQKFTATPGEGVTRLTYSKEDLEARQYIKEKMEAYGLHVTEDGFGNIFGKLDGALQNAPSVIVGSHFDSVPNGGAYDGTAGVVVGLEVAALFQEYGLKPTYPLEVIAMVEEEGSRFGGGLMGSRGMMGLLTEEAFDTLTDHNGVHAIEAMREIGLDPTKPKARDPQSIKAFLELHIEQGPILEEKGIDIGIVESIVGLAQLEVTVQGQAGHAGTTPMNRRADALVAAAKVIAALPDIAAAESADTVITTGRLNVFPNGANVIPEKIVFTLDIRSGIETHVVNAIQKVKALMSAYEKDGIHIAVEEQLFIQPKKLDEKIKSLFKEASDELQLPYHSMNSGAGHDAMVFSDYTSSGMVFIPSKDGLSHCPEEWSDVCHLAAGTDILFKTAIRLTEAKRNDQ